MFETVNLCALVVNGGQHIFFLYECWMVIYFRFFFVAIGRLLQWFREGLFFF